MLFGTDVCTDFQLAYSSLVGANVAKYSGEGLHKRIVGDKAFAKGDYVAAIKNGFLEMDRALRFGTLIFPCGYVEAARFIGPLLGTVLVN